ncbi:MAG TPA: hypothetical protein VIK61_20265 [Acidimicrobiia bacterium]
MGLLVGVLVGLAHGRNRTGEPRQCDSRCRDGRARRRGRGRRRRHRRRGVNGGRATHPTDQVDTIAAHIPERDRALIYVAAYSSLRLGEPTGLRRRDVNPLHKTVTAARQITEVRGQLHVGPPKTASRERPSVTARARQSRMLVARLWHETPAAKKLEPTKTL